MYKLYIAFCIFVYSISSTSAQEVLPRTLSEFDADQSKFKSNFYPGFSFNKDLSLVSEPFFTNVGDASLLNIPLLAKVQLGDSRFSLVAGPEANFFIDETGKDLHSFGVGLGIGLQYEISNSLLIEGRYSFGITNKFNTMPDDYASRFNTFYISLIYRF